VSSHYSHRTTSISLFISYLLVVTLCAPFSTQASSSSSGKAAPRQDQTPAAHRQGELLVRFRDGVSRQTKDLIIATQGAKKKKQLRGDSGFEALELPTGRDASAAALQLMLNPQVAFAEPNFLISKDDLTPNDTRFNEQWALRNTGQNGGQFGSDVKASAAWAISTGSKSTVIAVIDSGIDFTHPDLTNNQWLNPTPGENQDLHGWDYVAESANIKDEQGHGTAVAGYGVPSGMAATANVSFAYDAAGNRTSMTDGLGSVITSTTRCRK
jgi:subtilisin family serine protease